MMIEKEAVHIALEFWNDHSDRPVEEIISKFSEYRHYWSVILVLGEDEDDFVGIVVNPETEKAKIFQML